VTQAVTFMALHPFAALSFDTAHGGKTSSALDHFILYDNDITLLGHIYHQVLIYIKSKLLMPAKPLHISGNIKSMIPLWDRRQLSPTYIPRISLILTHIFPRADIHQE